MHSLIEVQNFIYSLEVSYVEEFGQNQICFKADQNIKWSSKELDAIVGSTRIKPSGSSK